MREVDTVAPSAAPMTAAMASHDSVESVSPMTSQAIKDAIAGCAGLQNGEEPETGFSTARSARG
ncbi:hypothetical protein [Propionimicrobium lymphophilum]|uniref:hypothetical protein n=1 Tax=Propionimicrobium lymphophilum TaxID=33012 RepID=UPI0023F0939A|nr:hypothetical protein [Propionimicrobium lymphophilum]